MSKRYPYAIRISFDNTGVSEFESVDGAMRISGAKDDFRLSGNGLLIRYERSGKQDIREAFNKTRLSRIEELCILYYAIMGSFPEFGDIEYETSDGIQHANAKDVKLWGCPSCRDAHLVSSQIAMRLYESDSRLSAIASISYIFASRKTADEVSRFRYLWSSFNCLYKRYPCDGNAEYMRAHALLSALPATEALDDLRAKFRKEAAGFDAPCWRWNDFLKGFSPLKVTTNKNGVVSIHRNASTVLGYATEGILNVIKSRPQYKRWDGLKPNKNPMLLRLAGLKSGNVGDEFLFIFSFYLYWYRCDTMHGNTRYPVFMDDEQKRLLNQLCDILESLIPLCIPVLFSKPDGK